MLLSRVADSLYWIGRYLERAEHIARVIDVRLDLGLDRLDREAGSDGWDFDRLYAGVRLDPSASPPLNPSMLVDALMFRVSTRDSLIGCVTAARDNARQVREEL